MQVLVAFVSLARADGAALYAQHCALCHGERGDGRGPAAQGLPERPADLTRLEPAAPSALVARFRPSGPDAPTGGFLHLSDEEAMRIAGYVATLSAR